MSSALQLAEILARPPQILVVDDDPLISLMFQKLAQEFEIALTCASSPVEGMACLDRQPMDAVFLDMRFEGTGHGMDMVHAMNRLKIDTMVIIMSGSVNLHEVMSEANQMGVVSFMLKPLKFDVAFLVQIFNRLRIRLVPRRAQLPSKAP